MKNIGAIINLSKAAGELVRQAIPCPMLPQLVASNHAFFHRTDVPYFIPCRDTRWRTGTKSATRTQDCPVPPRPHPLLTC